MLEALRRYPTRFRGVAVVDPNITRCKLDEMAKLGVTGIRLNLIGVEIPDLTQPAWQHLLEHIKATGWHVELHRAARDLPALITVLLKSGVKIVVDHFALPSQEEKQNDPGFQFLMSMQKRSKFG